MMKTSKTFENFFSKPLTSKITKKTLEYKGRKIIPIEIDFARYISECQLIKAYWEDTNKSLTDEELETLFESDEFQENFEGYIWDMYPEENILAMDQ